MNHYKKSENFTYTLSLVSVGESSINLSLRTTTKRSWTWSGLQHCWEWLNACLHLSLGRGHRSTGRVHSCLSRGWSQCLQTVPRCYSEMGQRLLESPAKEKDNLRNMYWLLCLFLTKRWAEYIRILDDMKIMQMFYSQRCHRYYPKFPELYSRCINSLIITALKYLTEHLMVWNNCHFGVSME